MDHLVYLALPSAFYGLATQQVLEVLFSVLPTGDWRRYQKLLSKAVAIVVGAVWAIEASNRSPTNPPLPIDQVLLAGLLTAACAELANAILKLLVYAKEERKAAAADALSISGSISLDALNRK